MMAVRPENARTGEIVVALHHHIGFEGAGRAGDGRQAQQAKLLREVGKPGLHARTEGRRGGPRRWGAADDPHLVAEVAQAASYFRYVGRAARGVARSDRGGHVENSQGGSSRRGRGKWGRARHLPKSTRSSHISSVSSRIPR